MWTGQRSITDLTRRSAWKVEFFAGDSRPSSGSRFPLVPLSEIVRERRQTIDPQATPDRALNYLSLENVQSLTGDLVGFSPKFGREILSRSKVFQPGDVLYARLRPKLNKVYLAEREVADGICSGEFYVLVPDVARIVPLFLRTALVSDLVHPFLAGCQTGSALPRVRLHDLMEARIPLPPLDVQEKLAADIARVATRRRALLREAGEIVPRVMSEFVAGLEKGNDA
jgi:type I restriction enzyme S subunit